MKKVLLVADIGGHEDQKYYHIGDEAMLYETYRWYRQLPKKWTISALSWFQTHEQLNLSELPHLHWSSPSHLYFPLLLSKLLWWRFTKHSLFSKEEFKLVSAIGQHDRIHFTGGGNLSSSFRPWMYYCFFIIFTARLLRKEILLTSQTIGPISGIDKLFAFCFLNCVNFIAIRSNTSPKTFLHKYGLFSPKIMNMLDAAYSLPLSKTSIFAKISSAQKNRVTIGLSLHAWRGWEETIGTYVTKTLNALANEYKLTILLIPHHIADPDVGTDVDFMRSIAKKLSGKITQIVPPVTDILRKESPPETYIKQLTSQVDVMLTTRYHGVIFSLSTHVPTLALNFDQYYQEKNVGALKMFYEDDWSAYSVHLGDKEAPRKILKQLRWLITNHETEKRRLKKINQQIDTRINQLKTIMLEFA